MYAWKSIILHPRTVTFNCLQLHGNDIHVQYIHPPDMPLVAINITPLDTGDN